MPKAFPAGIVALTTSLDSTRRIGTIGDHAWWTNVNADGVRLRIPWKELQTPLGVRDWSLLDECFTLAAATGKFIGLSVGTGLGAPPNLYGGETFTDGSFSGSNVTSLTANFTLADVGRVLYTDRGNDGGCLITGYTSPTQVTVDLNLGNHTGEKFSVLARNPGMPFRYLTAPDSGVMSVPWDPVFRNALEAFIPELGARYDGNPILRYIAMTGFQQTGECYLAKDITDQEFFDQSALDAGYSTEAGPCGTYSEGLVAWKDMVQNYVTKWMAAFPTTALLITGSGAPMEQPCGQAAMQDIYDWGFATFPNRFGAMMSQLHVLSNSGQFVNAPIYAHRLTNPTGGQFLNSVQNICNVHRLCKSDGTADGCSNYGPSPFHPKEEAFDITLGNAVEIGMRYPEVYEGDLNDTSGNMQSIIAARRLQFLGLSGGQIPMTFASGSGLPVTILEADIFFALESAPLDGIWMGGCAEKIRLGREVENLVIEYPGLPDRRRKKIAETHSIQIGNLWLINTNADPPAMPAIVPGESYRMEITWTEEDTGYTAKRTYTGVTLKSQQIETPGQDLVFEASTMTEEAALPEGALLA